MRFVLPFLLLVSAGLSLAQDPPTPVPPAAPKQDDKQEKKEEKGEGLPTIAEKTKGLTERPGLIASFVDPEKAKVYVKFPKANEKRILGEYLYIESLQTGLGSNDIGLDRSGFGNTWVIQVKQIGERAMFEAPNLDYRAVTDNLDEQRAVREGFANSIIWAGPIIAKDADGSVLIEITDFLVKDIHGIARSLEDQGGHTLDSGRTMVDPQACKAFPENLEFESILTFQSKKPSGVVGQHSPDPQSVTFIQRHSFVKLPEPGYKARKFDPRAGSFGLSYMDFAAPLDQPLMKRFIGRHRLEKVIPGSAPSKVKEPIVYYVDRGVPEPVRTALVEGGNYWKEAFEAAGYIDAFRVEVMPEGMDPLDARYNVVQWMNRSTRGWAYGQSVVDPRTGEILKGAVNLDSQRSRQDILIFESLLGVGETGKGGPNDPIRVALSRIRQLGAHEIGHTLGFQHNFAASFFNRASVMDYPAPLIKVTPAGGLDLSDAYTQGVGAWDVQTVKFAYSEFDSGVNEDVELDRIIQEGLKKGLVFLSDGDTTESIGANPLTNRWDSGNDPIAGLQDALKIRSIGMKGFGQRNIRKGQPVANLEQVFGPLYFFHRYQVEAVAKMVGGLHYRHALVGDGQVPQSPVGGARQREALRALVACLEPATLQVPTSIAALMGPQANGYRRTGEEFVGASAFAFDSVAAASSAADIVIRPLLNPARCARVLELSSRDGSLPSLDEVLSQMSGSIVQQPKGMAMQKEIGWAVQHVFATRLIDLASSDAASPGVRARALTALRRMRAKEQAFSSSESTGHAGDIAAQIQRFLSRPLTDAKRAPAPPAALPGAPIGSFACGYEW